MPTLVVFDWDGTLMDSLGTMVACAEDAMRDLDIEPPPAAAIRGAIGLGLEDVFALLMPDRRDPDLRARLVRRYRERWLTGYYLRSRPLAGAGAALDALARADYLLAVATGKSRAGLTHDLATTGFGPFFLATRTADDARSKPHPQMLLEILDELGVAASDALMVGDTTFDLDMARTAAVPSVGVLTGGHDEPTLRGSAPLTCLDSVSDLPGWLARARQPSSARP